MRQFLLKDIVTVTLNFSTTKAMENDLCCANEQGRAENCILVATGERVLIPLLFLLGVASTQETRRIFNYVTHNIFFSIGILHKKATGKIPIFVHIFLKIFSKKC